MKETNQLRTGLLILLLAGLAGGLLLSSAIFSLDLSQDAACSVPAVCNLGVLVQSGQPSSGTDLALPVSLLSWGLILIPAGYAAWYFRKSEKLYRPLSLVFVLLLVVLVIRISSPAGLSPALLNGTSFGIALLAQAVVIAGMSWLATSEVSINTAELGAAQRTFSVTGRFYKISLLALAAVFVTLISGALLSMRPPIIACTIGFLCLPDGAGVSGLDWFQIAHWMIVGSSALLILALSLEAWRFHARIVEILVPATAVAVLFSIQILIGGLEGLRADNPELLGGLHSIVSAGVWSLIVYLVIRAGPALRTTAVRPPLDGTIRDRTPMDFLKLTKPFIVLLLLLTTFSGMVLAGGALPGLALAFWTCLAGAFAAGGSSAINQYIDRDRDRLMSRTARRPIASGRILPAEGLAFGVALCLISFFLMAIFVNLLAAILSLIGIIYYVYLYSILLKNATVQNIVIGGGAGAIPPLVGWAAVTGSLTAASLMLFVVIFMWTPPHFWALALVRRKDYARAGVPMLPVVRGEPETRRQIFIYSVILVLITLTLPLFGLGDSVYLVGSAILGMWLLYAAWRVLRIGGNKVAWKMYRYSSMYLAFLFLVLVADTLLG
ncbi:MAG TPA: heme o synthase [Anaerolineales bacterium]|nr:heme o synthase [Anaerolineales bacterium]